MKLQHKQLMIYFLLGLLIWGAGYVIISTSQNVVNRLMGKYAISKACHILDTLDHHVYAGVEHVQLHMRSLASQGVLVASNAAFDRMENVEAVMQQRDRQWQETPRNEITPLMDSCIDNPLVDYLRDTIMGGDFYGHLANHALYGEVFLTNKYGAMVASSDRTSDYYQADETWWQQAKEHGTYIGDVAFDDSMGGYALPLAICIDDANDSLVGILKMSLNLNGVIKQWTSDTEKILSESARVLLLNRDRTVIYDETGLFTFQEDISEVDLFKSIYTDEGFFLVEGIDNDRTWLFSYVQSREQQPGLGLGWLLIIVYDTTSVFDAAIQFSRNGLLLLSVLTVFIIVVNVILSKSVGSRIRMLSLAMQRAAAGQFGTQVTIRSKDELGEFASAFNRLVSDVRSSMVSAQELHREIARRKEAEAKCQDLEAQLKEAREPEAAPGEAYPHG
jgi:HAMP domain-containing protein